MTAEVCLIIIFRLSQILLCCTTNPQTQICVHKLRPDVRSDRTYAHVQINKYQSLHGNGHTHGFLPYVRLINEGHCVHLHTAPVQIHTFHPRALVWLQMLTSGAEDCSKSALRPFQHIRQSLWALWNLWPLTSPFDLHLTKEFNQINIHSSFAVHMQINKVTQTVDLKKFNIPKILWFWHFST